MFAKLEKEAPASAELDPMADFDAGMHDPAAFGPDEFAEAWASMDPSAPQLGAAGTLPDHGGW
jgi:hypothetical protein